MLPGIPSDTRQVLRRDLERGEPLLRILSFDADARVAMMMRGYSDEEHARGWRLYLHLIGFGHHLRTEEALISLEQEQARKELNEWMAQNYERAMAAVECRHPVQAKFLFREALPDLKQSDLMVLDILIKNAGILRQGSDPERADSREADREAIRILEQRLILGPEREARLREKLNAIINPPWKTEEIQAEEDRSRALYLEKAREFHGWLKEWRTTARACIGNRNLLVKMGVAQNRRARKDKE